MLMCTPGCEYARPVIVTVPFFASSCGATESVTEASLVSGSCAASARANTHAMAMMR